MIKFLKGKGTFKPLENSKPYVGKIGESYSSEEQRIEVIYPKYKEGDVLCAMQDNHPYEEIAHQIYLIQNQYQ